MNIIITADEAIKQGIWEELCKLKGINPWIINEGIAKPTVEITLTLEEAQKLRIQGIVEVKENAEHKVD